MIYISHSVGKVMVCYKHTLTYCLSKFGTCIEAGWSLATVCIEYVKLDNMQFVHGRLSTTPQMYKRNLTDVYTGFVCLSANKSGFVAPWAKYKNIMQ